MIYDEMKERELQARNLKSVLLSRLLDPDNLPIFAVVQIGMQATQTLMIHPTKGDADDFKRELTELLDKYFLKVPGVGFN